jgi:integrase
MLLVFLRPKNIRFMKWTHIDFDAALMTIPKKAMKMGKELKVPLGSQALAILNEAHKRARVSVYVKGKNKPIGESATTNAIRRMMDPRTGKAFGTGFMTSHDFRHTARNMLNELEYLADAIELQMALVTQNVVRETYNKAQLMPTRVKMMIEWAAYIDSLINP